MVRELKIVAPTAGMKNLSLGLSSIARFVGSLKSNVFELAKEPIPSELIESPNSGLAFELYPPAHFKRSANVSDRLISNVLCRLTFPEMVTIPHRLEQTEHRLILSEYH